MDFKDVQRGFEEKVAQSVRAAQRLRRIRTFTKAGRVRKLTAALDDADMFLPMMAAEELAKTGRVDAVPGIIRALMDPRLGGSAITGIMDALRNPARVQTGFREQLLPVIISQAVNADRIGVVDTVLALSPVRGALDLFVAATKAGRTLPPEVLLEIANDGCGRLPAADLVPIAEALLPHRGSIRTAEAFDALMKRLLADCSVSLPDLLREAVEVERQGATPVGPAFAGIFRTLRRIAESGKDHWDRISALHQALDDRFARQGISVGFNENRECELQHLTRPEWIIRTLNCFLCCCENSGSLAGQARWGFRSWSISMKSASQDVRGRCGRLRA